MTMATQNNTQAMRDKIRELVDAGADKYDAAKNQIMNAKDKVVDRRDALVKTIEKHPLAAVGIAFGIGFFVMRLMR
jgi:ElaB/YqjD/DUF883 family membrane-anchored ribosome-binding protein